MEPRATECDLMVKTVGVIGAGTMGNGIAQVFAQAGFTVELHDASAAAIGRARAAIEKSLAKFVEKGKLTAADRDAALGRLNAAPALDEFAEVDYVVEAIVENVDAKRDAAPPSRHDHAPGRDSRHQHVVDLDHAPRRGDDAARTSCSACTS